MNNKNTIKTLWGGIIMLLLMNVGMMCWLWFMPDGKPRLPEQLFLEKELGFNEQQKEKYREMRTKYFSDMSAIRDSIRPMKEIMLKRIIEDSLTDEEVFKISLATETKMAKVNLLTFKHLREVRNFCTPEQRQKFDRIIDKIVGFMARPEPPRQQGGMILPNGERQPPQEGFPPR
jgi:periplasmic protein CpxP/Spy